jgi:hypothetical protein
LETTKVLFWLRRFPPLKFHFSPWHGPKLILFVPFKTVFSYQSWLWKTFDNEHIVLLQSILFEFRLWIPAAWTDIKRQNVHVPMKYSFVFLYYQILLRNSHTWWYKLTKWTETHFYIKCLSISELNGKIKLCICRTVADYYFSEQSLLMHHRSVIRWIFARKIKNEEISHSFCVIMFTRVQTTTTKNKTMLKNLYFRLTLLGFLASSHLYS